MQRVWCFSFGRNLKKNIIPKYGSSDFDHRGIRAVFHSGLRTHFWPCLQKLILIFYAPTLVNYVKTVW